MKLMFKQRFFSFLDSYDIYDQNGNVYFKVQGQISFGHSFIIYNKYNEEVGKLKQKLFTFLPKYEVYIGNNQMGLIQKEFTFFKPKFNVTFGNYTVDGDFFEWDYRVYKDGRQIATLSKQLFNFTDTYIIDVDDNEALIVLMIVLAIDSIKDRQSSNNN